MHAVQMCQYPTFMTPLPSLPGLPSPPPFSLGCVQYSTQKAEERLLCILLIANQRVIMGEAWERGYAYRVAT